MVWAAKPSGGVESCPCSLEGSCGVSSLPVQLYWERSKIRAIWHWLVLGIKPHPGQAAVQEMGPLPSGFSSKLNKKRKENSNRHSENALHFAEWFWLWFGLVALLWTFPSASPGLVSLSIPSRTTPHRFFPFQFFLTFSSSSSNHLQSPSSSFPLSSTPRHPDLGISSMSVLWCHSLKIMKTAFLFTLMFVLGHLRLLVLLS